MEGAAHGRDVAGAVLGAGEAGEHFDAERWIPGVEVPALEVVREGSEQVGRQRRIDVVAERGEGEAPAQALLLAVTGVDVTLSVREGLAPGLAPETRA